MDEKSQKKSGGRKISDIIGNILIFVAVFVVLVWLLSLVLPKFSYGLVAIKTGSMEPTIKTGGAVIIKAQDMYGTDDTITFVKTKGELVTHRIVEIGTVDGATVYTTKGDNNNAVDVFPVVIDDVRGRVVFTLPYIGYGIAFFQSRIGIMLLILIPAVYFIGREVIKIKEELKKKKEFS